MATSSDTSDQNNVKSRRPAESAFKQQRLPAWQPILTAGTVLPTFFVLGIAFIPVGIGLLYFSDEVKEHIIDYTSCVKKDEAITCADYIKQMSMSQENKCICEMDFNLTEDFQGDVFFYYGLSNFYQNHRRYVKSRDDEQLLGRLDRAPSSDCEPFATHQDKPIAPCGAIANSLFNDTLSLYSVELQQDVPVLRTGIAWNSDKNIKFRNPDLTPFNGSLQAAFANYTKPKNWAVNVWELDLNDPNNNGFQNEDLIVWMRTAALPTFRKLYRRVDHSQPGFQTGLGKGPYTLRITYNYPVTEFDGTKSFVISTTSLLGGKNPFLGVAYIVVGTLCLLLGIVLLIIHVRCSKRFYPIPTDSFFVGLDNTLPHGMSPRIRMYSEDLDMRPPPGKVTQSKMLFFEANLEDEDANILEHDETVEPKTEKVDADDESPLFPVEIEFKASKTGKRQSETEDGKAFKTHARFTESAKELPRSRVASTSRLSTSSLVDASQAIPSSSRDQTTTPNPHKHKTFKERIRSISKIFSSKDIHEKAKQGLVDQTDSVPMANTLNSTVDAQTDRLTSDKTVQAGKAKIENLTDTEIIELEKPIPNKQTSDTVRQSTPDTVKQTTDSKGLTSDTVQQSHNTDDKTSDTVKLVDRTSDANGQTPDKAKQTPNVKGETPDKANREPDTDVQTTDSEISKTDTNNTEPDSENKDKKA